MRRIAYALGVRLKVEFVEWGDILTEVKTSDRAHLQRRRFEDDPAFMDDAADAIEEMEPALTSSDRSRR